ncbi:MAG: hypothetical protein V3V85_01785 [Candidatus Thorarchaeota archaeon]
MPRPDVYDIKLMLGVRNRDSITEIGEDLSMNIATVHTKLVELQEMGYINPPRKPGAARDRSMTEMGENYLVVNGHVTPQIFGP